MWRFKPQRTAPMEGSRAEPEAMELNAEEGIGSVGEEVEVEDGGCKEEARVYGIERRESSDAMPDSPRMKILGREGGRWSRREM